jgi:hypothetical protein
MRRVNTFILNCKSLTPPDIEGMGTHIKSRARLLSLIVISHRG